MPDPTEEQRIAIERFAIGHPLKISAFAGSGKTTTLELLAQSRPTTGLYLAFNKAIAAEAKRRFPRHVDCRTTHSLAFRAVSPLYRNNAKLTSSLSPRQLAQIMGYTDKIFRGRFRLLAVHQAFLVLATIRQFCQSSDTSVQLSHIPVYGRLTGLDKGALQEIHNWALDQASAVWKVMVAPQETMALGHDGYLKLWALAGPRLAADYVLLDEAQDTNEVVLGVLKSQSAQIVYVGDRHQQIYEWRGAINAMETVIDCETASLTQSFRFGQSLADRATEVIATLGETEKIRGNPTVTTSIVATGDANAVLCRTNATVIQEILNTRAAGGRPHVVGGTADLRRLVQDVYELKKGNPGVCPEFFGFQNWAEVVEFASSEEGNSIRTFVRLVEQNGEDGLWAAISSAVDNENQADVTLSTAHKAKGRQWRSVRLTNDFVSFRLGNHPDAPSEVRLFYVAMTRAREALVVAPEVLSMFCTDGWKSPNYNREIGEISVPAVPVRVRTWNGRPPGAPPVPRQVRTPRPAERGPFFETPSTTSKRSKGGILGWLSRLFN